jgi:hypothetical protein
MLLFNNCYTTVSGSFFAMCMFIFHKTEVQRVILICIMGLNFNWFKSNRLKCILRLKSTLANSQKNGNWQMAILWPFLVIFFANFIFIFHKTEAQTVILRCWPNLNQIGTNFYSLKSKKGHKRKKPIWGIFYKIAKKWKRKYLDFVS